MSIRIGLYFREFYDPTLVAKKLSGRAIRLFVEMRFKTRDGWTPSFSAIADTGAPTSVIPFKIWSRCEVKLLADHVMRGVIPKEECALPVLIGEVPCVLADRQQQSKERIVTAYLTFTDDVPLIAGFEGLLDRWRLHMDYDSKEAYLEGEW